MDGRDFENNSHEVSAKADSLFAPLEKTKKKGSKLELVFYIFGITSAIIGVNAIIAIFTGRLSIRSSEILDLGRSEAIVTSIVCIVLAIVFLFLGQKVSDFIEKSEAKIANAPIVPIEQYEATRNKCIIFRIAYYTLLGILLLSPVGVALTEGSALQEIVLMVVGLSFFAFFPVLILFLFFKRKLKLMKPGGAL